MRRYSFEAGVGRVVHWLPMMMLTEIGGAIAEVRAVLKRTPEATGANGAQVDLLERDAKLRLAECARTVPSAHEP